MSLWEICIGVLAAGLMAGVMASSNGKAIDAARGERTLKDMAAILEGSRQYDAIHGEWPASWAELGEVLPNAEMQNLWGDPYVLGADLRCFWVETDVPSGALRLFLNGRCVVVSSAGGKDKVRLMMSRSYGQAARLVYEKNHVYVP